MPKARSTTTARTRSPRCSRCNKAIRVPAGWSHGAAVRRHYWAKHRDVMQPELGRKQG